MEIREYIEALTGSDGPAWGPANRVIVGRTDSTNRLARHVVSEYRKEEMVPPGLLILALEQTAGRGRHGRFWRSPAGRGVYATRVLSVSEPRLLQTVPLLAAVGLARAVDDLVGDGACGLKWPNDLMVGEKKLGGVLVESMSSGTGQSVAMVGFGVNYSGSDGSGPLEGLSATSICEEAAEPPSLGKVTRLLVASLDSELEHVDDVPYAIDRFRELTIHRPGDPVRCRVGDEVVEGAFRGFDERGFLRLEADGAERLVGAGDLVEAESIERSS